MAANFSKNFEQYFEEVFNILRKMKDRLPFKLAGTDDFVNGAIDIVHALDRNELIDYYYYGEFYFDRTLLTIVRDFNAFIHDTQLHKFPKYWNV